MKISSEQIQQMLHAQGVKGTGKTHRVGRPNAAAAADGASLSAASQDISKALGIIGKTPDVRADRVAALKQQIADGTYRVSGMDIAESLLAGPSGEPTL